MLIFHAPFLECQSNLVRTLKALKASVNVAKLKPTVRNMSVLPPPHDNFLESEMCYLPSQCPHDGYRGVCRAVHSC